MENEIFDKSAAGIKQREQEYDLKLTKIARKQMAMENLQSVSEYEDKVGLMETQELKLHTAFLKKLIQKKMDTKFTCSCEISVLKVEIDTLLSCLAVTLDALELSQHDDDTVDSMTNIH